MFQVSPVTGPHAPSERGALAFYSATCSCGWSGRSSLVSLARQDAAAHERFHTRRR